VASTITHTIKPGGGGDYTSLNSWETAQARDLVSADEIAEASCYSGGSCVDSASNFQITGGWTTDATRFCRITAPSAERHASTGTFDTGKAYISQDGARSYCIYTTENFEATFMQWRMTNCTGYRNVIRTLGSMDYFRANANLAILENDYSGTNDSGIFRLQPGTASGADKNAWLTNNIAIIEHLTYTTNDVYMMSVYFPFTTANTWTLHCYNNTFINPPGTATARQCIWARNGNCVVNTDNNYIYGSRSYGPITGGATYNKGTADASGVTNGTAQYDVVTPALSGIGFSTSVFTNVTYATYDFTPTATSALLDAGNDVSATAPDTATDILGETRSVYDIGAVEGVSTVEGTSDIDGVGTLSIASYFIGEEIDCYDIANGDDFKIMWNNGLSLSQSFTGTGIPLTRAMFWGYRSGTPSGTLQCDIYAHSGTYGTSSVPTGSSLATSTTTYVAADITTSAGAHQEIPFRFDGTFTPANGTQYCVVLTGFTGTISNFLAIATDDSSPSHGGNPATEYPATTWTADATEDICFCMSGAYTIDEPAITITGIGSSSIDGYALIVPSTMAGVGTAAATADSIMVGAHVSNYDVANQDDYIALDGTGTTSVAASFGVPLRGSGGGGMLRQIRVWGYKTFSPGGTLSCSVYAHSGVYGTSSVPTGSALSTSTSVFPALANISGGPATNEILFDFPQDLFLEPTEDYVFVITGLTGAAPNFVLFATDSSSPASTGNVSTETAGSGTFTPIAGEQMCFQVFTSFSPWINGSGSLSVSSSRVITGFLSMTIVEETAMGLTFLTQEAMLSTTEIWNTALTALGVSLVSGTSDNSRQGTLLQSVWAPFRKQFLTEHPWAGCKTTQSLSRFTNTDSSNVDPDGTRWNNAFLLPDSSDSRPYLHALYINGYPNTPNSSTGNYWEIEVCENDAGTQKRCLMTNESTVNLQYVFDPGDNGITLLSELTRHAMGLALAYHIAPNFGKPAKERELLRQAAEEAVMKAKGNDGQESTPSLFQNTPLLDARERGWF
jgi:hypothetical protein